MARETDSAGIEQESVCVRYVDEYLRPVEVFLGLCALPNARGATIAEAITNFLSTVGLLSLAAMRRRTTALPT